MEPVLVGCVAMIIEVVSQGGFGGLTGVQVTRRAVVEDLPSAAQEQYCARFDPGHLSELAAVVRPLGAADTISYEITVVDEEGARHHFVLDETLLPAELLDLIDALPRAR